MKKKKVIFYSLMFLPLAVVLIALQFLPEQIPAHYDMNNQVTRWGSKYETLIFPVITILFGYFMLGMAKFSAKQEENGSNNENVCIVAGIVSLALFNAMTGYFLYADFNSIENLSSIALDINQLLFGLLGVAMIILGNIMPKLRMNSVVGLRTVWSIFLIAFACFCTFIIRFCIVRNSSISISRTGLGGISFSRMMAWRNSFALPTIFLNRFGSQPFSRMD